MFCMKCGQRLPDNALFCLRCRTSTMNNTVFENKSVKTIEKAEKEEDVQKLEKLKEEQTELNKEALQELKWAIEDARESRSNTMGFCGLVLFFAMAAAAIFGLEISNNLTTGVLSAFMISCATAIGIIIGMIRLYRVRSEAIAKAEEKLRVFNYTTKDNTYKFIDVIKKDDLREGE